MSESADKGSKTEEATEKKKRDSVEKGNVPFSREAPIFASLMAMLAIGSLLISAGAGRLTISLQRMLDDPGGWSLDNGADAIQLLNAVALEAAGFLAAPLLVLSLAGVAASLLQNAPSLALKRITPEFSRISPAKGWTRIFGMQGQAEFLKSTFKFIAIAAVATVLLGADQYDVVNAMFVDPSAVPGLILSMSIRLLAAISVATIVLVAADLVWSRISWNRQLRMTRQEVKDEMKQAEGDPLLKARRLSLARDRSRRRMMAAVPRATLVIANPTHYAIALRYERNEGGAPLVLAKGTDLVALRIREIAEGCHIPVIEDKLLARSLYDKVEVDRMIPAEFYRAIAEIIFFLQSRNAVPPGKL